MHETRILLGCLVAVFCCAGTWQENGKPVADTKWARSDGDLGAQLVLTDKPDELFAAWLKPSPGVFVSQTSTAVRGGAPIVGVIFFVGCAPNVRGNCEVTAHFQAYGPDGKPWGDAIDAEVWVEKPPPGDNRMQLSIGNMGLLVEPLDSLGKYKVRADVVDKVAGKKMSLERRFTATESQPGK